MADGLWLELPLLVLDVQLKSNLEYITKSAKLPNGCLSKLTKTHLRKNDSEDFFNVPMEIVTISNFTLNNKKILAENYYKAAIQLKNVSYF